MRIAIASDGGTHVAAHTGRCEGFVVFDVVNNQPQRLEYRENNFTAHAQGGCHTSDSHQPGASHHSHAPLLIALHDCEALLTGGLGPRLVADLAARGITAYVGASGTVEMAAQAFAAGRLRKATSADCCPGEHAHPC